MTLEEEKVLVKSLHDQKWGGEFKLMELLRFPTEKASLFASIDMKELFSSTIINSVIIVDDNSDNNANKKNHRETFLNEPTESTKK